MTMYLKTYFLFVLRHFKIVWNVNLKMLHASKTELHVYSTSLSCFLFSSVAITTCRLNNHFFPLFYFQLRIYEQDDTFSNICNWLHYSLMIDLVLCAKEINLLAYLSHWLIFPRIHILCMYILCFKYQMLFWNIKTTVTCLDINNITKNVLIENLSVTQP